MKSFFHKTVQAKKTIDGDMIFDNDFNYLYTVTNNVNVSTKCRLCTTCIYDGLYNVIEEYVFDETNHTYELIKKHKRLCNDCCEQLIQKFKKENYHEHTTSQLSFFRRIYNYLIGDYCHRSKM